MKTAFAALALATALSSPVMARPAPIAVAPAEDVDTLVALLLPEDAMLRLGGRSLEYGMNQEVAKNPQLKAQYEKYPGLRPFVVAELAAAFAQVMKAEMPALRGEIRGVILAGMTREEISATLVFFSSPTGQKVRAQVYETMGDKPGQNAEQMKQAAMAAVMASMQPEDYPALIAFGSSSAAQKMQAVNPKITAASEAWSARMVEKNGARMRALSEQAAKRYLAKQQ